MRLAGPIADALRRGAAVITATPRAARALHLAYADDRQASGATMWAAPAIRDWDSWLRELWRAWAFEHPEGPVLLTPLQEQALWTKVQQEDAALVLSPESMASLATEAWNLLSAYGAHAERRRAWEQVDADRFRHWALEFERACTRHGWMSASELESRLTETPVGMGSCVQLPAEILLVGFDQLTPVQRTFLEVLRSAGLTVEEHSPRVEFAPDDPRRRWLVATDRREEIAACAAWAREMLAARPGARIGIIASGIAEVRGEIERTFRRALMPESDDIRRASARMPFEFSLGRPLAEMPAIRAALLILRWIDAPLRHEEIGWLMLSGFVSDTDTQWLAVAQHDAELRTASSLSPQRSIESYRASLARFPALRPVYESLGRLLRGVQANGVPGQKLQHSTWAEIVHLLLERAGWPGRRSPDSIAFQARERWQRLLDELALLDFDGSLLRFGEFVKLLDRHAQQTIFAPESHDAPIQIMGPLESSGQQFDAIWFLGTDDTRWPMRGRMHPLLPDELQRKYRMPHSLPQINRELARTVTARLLASGPEIVFSYAQREQDAELRPSPLIAGLFTDNAEPIAHPGNGRAWFRQLELEEIADDSAVIPWPRERHAGGAEVLQRQAACPFRSFAAKRLGAKPLDENEWGLSPAEKGKLLHLVLQRLFTAEEPVRIRTSEDLVTAIDTNRMPEILDAHIDAVFRAPGGPESEELNAWQRACLAAEKRRLRVRIAAWLAIEAQRQPFVVEACERRLDSVHVGELRLRLRADRIDLLPDGSRLLIDYKTGRISPAAWHGERPEEPQLPLYAAFGNVEHVSGVLFAQIRAGETKFDGRLRDARAQLLADIGDRKALVSDPYSDAMRDTWARALENLALEFLEGEAAVAPREAKVCSNCALPGLCRKAELNLAFDESGGEENGDV